MADINAITDGLRALAERVEISQAPVVPTLRQLNAYYVRAVVALHRGNRAKAARALGVAPSTVTMWLKRKVV